MKLITRDTDYAVRAVCRIAKSKKEITSAAELVKTLGIPRPFLRKILQLLNKKGILHSHKGKEGGFSLAVGVDNIYIFDLVEIFQQPFQLNECLFKKRICPQKKTCGLRKKIDSIEKYVISELRNISVGELMN